MTPESEMALASLVSTIIQQAVSIYTQAKSGKMAEGAALAQLAAANQQFVSDDAAAEALEDKLYPAPPVKTGGG